MSGGRLRLVVVEEGENTGEVVIEVGVGVVPEFDGEGGDALGVEIVAGIAGDGVGGEAAGGDGVVAGLGVGLSEREGLGGLLAVALAEEDGIGGAMPPDDKLRVGGGIDEVT